MSVFSSIGNYLSGIGHKIAGYFGGQQTTQPSQPEAPKPMFGPPAPTNYETIMGGVSPTGPNNITISPGYRNIPKYSGATPDYNAVSAQATRDASAQYDPVYNAETANEQDIFNANKGAREAATNHQIQLQNDLMDHFEQVTGVKLNRNDQDLQTALGTLIAQRGEQQQSTAIGRLKQLRSLTGAIQASGLIGSGFAGQMGEEANAERAAAADSAARGYQAATAATNLAGARGKEDILSNKKEQEITSAGTIQNIKDQNEVQKSAQDERLADKLRILQNEREANIGQFVNNAVGKAGDDFTTKLKNYYAQFGVNY